MKSLGCRDSKGEKWAKLTNGWAILCWKSWSLGREDEHTQTEVFRRLLRGALGSSDLGHTQWREILDKSFD